MNPFWSRWMFLMVIGGLVMTTPSSFAASSLSDTELDAVGALGEFAGVQGPPIRPNGYRTKPSMTSKHPESLWRFGLFKSFSENPYLSQCREPSRPREEVRSLKAASDCTPTFSPISATRIELFVTRHEMKFLD